MNTASPSPHGDDYTAVISQTGVWLSQPLDQPHLLETILNQSPSGLMICDAYGDFTFLNTAAKRLTAPGRAPASVAALFSTLGQEVSCPTGEKIPWILSQLSAGEPVGETDVCLMRPDSSYLCLLISSSPLKNAQNAVVGSILTCTDITEQQFIRQQLQDMRHAQSVAQTGNWRLDVQNNRLLWSDETYRIFGVAPDTAMTYEAFLAHIHPEDRDYVNESWQAALQGEPYDIEHRIIAGTQVKWVHERAELVFDDQGIVSGGFGTVQDITELKRAEAEIRSVARFPSENPSPVMRVSINGKVIYANEASRPIQTAWGCEVGHLLPPPWQGMVSRAICSGQTQELEADCGGIIFLVQFVPIANHDYVNIYGRDITTRKRAEERQQLLQDLVAGLAKTLTPEDVAATVIEQGIQAAGAAAGAVAMLNNSTQVLKLIGAVGYPPSFIDSWRCFPLDSPTTPLAEVVRTRQPFFYESPRVLQAMDTLLPAPLTEGLQAGAVMPLVIQGSALGALCFSFPTPRTFDESERRFLMTIAGYCAQALERSRLAEQALEAAALEERQRFARDLHDAVSQVLFASTVIAEAIPRMWDRSREKTVECLNQIVILNHAAMAEMRGLLLELRPETIDRMSLEALLRQLVSAAKGRKQIHADILIEGRGSEPAPDVVMTFYRIAQESINNILKHSQAMAFEIALKQEAQQVQLSIADNGKGFVPGEVSSSGVGLQFMCERAHTIGASLDVRSEPGKGTRITVRWPAEPR